MEARVAESVATSPSKWHTAIARGPEIETAVDEDLDLEANRVAQQQGANALLAPVLEHYLLHPGQGG